MALATILTFGLAFSLAAASIYPTRFEGTTWDETNWIIKATVLDQGHYQSRMSLANGYIGINVAAVGPFFEVDTPVNGDQINGWPLFDRRQTFATISGFWDSQPDTNGTNFEWLNQYGGESVISGIPHWGGLLLEWKGQRLDASVKAAQVSDFSSSLDIKKALLDWKYVWTPDGGPPIGIKYSMFVNKLHVNRAAIQLEITADKDVNLTVIDVLQGDCAIRTEFANSGVDAKAPVIWSAVHPNGINDVTGYVYSTVVGNEGIELPSRIAPSDGDYLGTNKSSIAQSFTANVRPGQTTVISKHIGAASTDAFEDPKSTARDASMKGAEAGFAQMLKAHSEEWSSIMPRDSVDSYALADGSLPNDENLVELQIISVVNPFHLLQNTVGDNAIIAAENNTRLDINSISVCGLGSECYAGFIFWDAEVWMAPGLVVSHPHAARQIANYRVELFPQAKENIKQAFTSSQNGSTFTEGGAVFPWTSARFGNCTGTGPCFDYEYHINGDIGLEVLNYYIATGDTTFFRETLFPVYDAIAYFFGELVAYDKTTKQYELYNATDPDEFANHINNPGFTMVLMKTHLETANELRRRVEMPENETWTDIASKMTIPVYEEANIILEYSSMNGSISVKQADVVLVDDLLDFPNPYSLADLDYYAGKQSPAGPAMTYSVFSIVANEVSPSGCSSYTYDLYASQPYVRGPWFQYSEQLLDNYEINGGFHPAFPFLTGMGGANRVAVFGYLGLRLMLDSLNIDPNLPPQIPQIKYRTIYWQGHPVSIFSNQTHTTLERLESSLPNSNSTFSSSPIPVTIGLAEKIYPLDFNAPLTIPNRRIGLNATQPGNIAQCQPATSPQKVVPGQFALAAVDGAISTKWQPERGGSVAWVDVALSPTPAEPLSTPRSQYGSVAPSFVPVAAFRFDWAQLPPVGYMVQFSNDSTFPARGVVVVALDFNVPVSDPYDASAVADIVPYRGNTTEMRLDRPVWSARFARLSIWGNRNDPAENATGASVAEWAIIAEGGNKVQARGLAMGTEEEVRPAWTYSPKRGLGW